MDEMLAFLEAFSKHQSSRLRWGELSEVRIPLERTSFLLQMPTTTIITMMVSTFLLASMLGCVLMATLACYKVGEAD
jgi:hypothetical protein